MAKSSVSKKMLRPKKFYVVFKKILLLGGVNLLGHLDFWGCFHFDTAKKVIHEILSYIEYEKYIDGYNGL